MGWNSWNAWGLAVDNEKVKASADVFISSGLADHGYTNVNIDDGWEAPARAKNGEMITNEKFPDIKATSDYVHSKGLRFGIYSSPGPKTLRGLFGKLSARNAGCINLYQMGNRLPEIRLVFVQRSLSRSE